jgi:UPF0755 protein
MLLLYNSKEHMMVKKILLSFGLLSILTICFLAYLIYDQMQPRKLDEPVAFSVAHGQSLNDISASLKDKGLIKNTLFFETYGKIKGFDRKISEGKHYFRFQGIKAVYEQLMSKGISEEKVSVTIPEGFTVEQIATKLANAGVVKKEEFLRVAKTGEGIDKQLLSEIPFIEDSKYRLEGYFFPDTYYFQENSNVITVSERMIRRLFNVLNTFDENGTKLSLHELVTLASIVEREAVLQEERAMIAGVFFNRLEKKWKLQACATVLYALGKTKERLLYEDLEIESPYNTYLLEGLPIGPIASPGKEALLSVLYPKEHEYFFYVVKGDGSRGHNFSKTFSQHRDYKAEALKQH